jgi:hypothetical protein
MLPNADKIAKPAKGRIFGLSMPELLGLIRQYTFQHSEFNKRIDIAMMNPEHESEHGILLASFCPGDFLALFSLPDSISGVRAKLLSTAAIIELAALDKKAKPQWNRQKKLSFRIYLGNLNRLVITERHRSLKLGKYRGGAKFSNAFKPKAVHVEERVIREVNGA